MPQVLSLIPSTLAEGLGTGSALAAFLTAARYILKSKVIRSVAVEVLTQDDEDDERKGDRRLEERGIEYRANETWENAVGALAEALRVNQEQNGHRLANLESELASTRIELANTKLELAHAQAQQAHDRGIVSTLQAEKVQFVLRAEQDEHRAVQQQRYIKLLEDKLSAIEEQMNLRDVMQQNAGTVLRELDERHLP